MNGAHHIYRNSPEDIDYFRLDVSQAGILTLEVSAGPRQAEPRQAGPSAAAGIATGPTIAWLGGDCSIRGTAAADGWQRPTAWSVMKVETPGTYFFAVVSGAREDFWPGFYALRVGFAATEPLPREDLAVKEIDEWESDPISITAPFGRCRGVFDKEIDEWESDPISIVAPPCRSADLLALERLCGVAERDDRGGLLACAHELPLGASVSSELRPDGLDAFSFVLTAGGQVVLETAGETDTHGQLLDAHGHRLGTDDDSGAGVNFRMVATLEPGRYFLRVAAVDAAERSAYVLETAYRGGK